MNVYDFVKEQEVKYQKPIDLESGWPWSMKAHLRRSFLYKNSQFEDDNENRDLRPNKNIILGIRNVQNRTEGFDVKDIDIYVDNPDFYYRSFIVRKYFEKWALENGLDTFIDDMVDSYGDYGGILARDTDENKPEVIDLRSLAFCNQKNILANPFCIKHELSPSQLREHENWGQGDATMDIERLIELCKDEESIIAYELIGTLPGDWLGSNKDGAVSKKKDEQQIQVIAYYQDQNKNEVGVTLFRHKLPKLTFKFLARDKIVGRALGRGGVEELFEPQVWTSWSESKITEMLEAASKTFFKSTDPAFKTRNNLRNIDNLEVLTLQEGRDITQLDTYPRNLVVFNNAVDRWIARAQELGSASEGLLSGEVKSGVPFKLFEAKSIEDKSMHIFRQGQIAVFMDEIIRDWILNHVSKDILNEHNFLSELSANEMNEVFEQISENLTNKQRNEQVLSGEIPTDKEAMKEKIKNDYMKRGQKWFIKILKGEMKDSPLKARTNIAGKQRNLALLTDKLTNVMRQFISTPEIRNDPEMVKLLNVILESSGLSPILLGTSGVVNQQSQLPQEKPAGTTQPLKELTMAK